MSIISALRTYLAAYSGLEANRPLWVDHLGPEHTEYGIFPVPGERIVERYITGGTVREFPFAFESANSTADDVERMETNGFYEAFADWLETQTEAGALPNLGAKKTATKIEALGWGYLLEQGESETGIYQIQCKLTYEQQP